MAPPLQFKGDGDTTRVAVTCFKTGIKIATLKNVKEKNSLVIQRLRQSTSTTGGTGSIPGCGTKIPCATWHSQKILKLTN